MTISNEQYVAQYLKRINYHGSTIPCLETLIALQRCHLYNVPFENLELLKDGFEPDLSREFLFDKIVCRRRGGVCHELNTSFYYLLTAMGFDACQIGGRSYLDKPMTGHAFTLIHLPEGDFTADVGYGDDAVPPLNLTTRECVEDYFAKFWIEDDDEGFQRMYLQRPGEAPAFQYQFSPKPMVAEDFIETFRETATKGITFFAEEYFCCRYQPEGKALFLCGVLTVTKGNTVVEKRNVAPGEESEQVLREYFGIS